MTSGNRIGLAASLTLAALAFTALAAPANAAWWGKDGQWHQDNRWNHNRNDNNWNNRYYGYHYREPPIVYGSPYNYGYTPPPVYYDNTPGFTIRFR